MRFTSAFTALAASTLAAVSASPFQDWKYSLGWDGTVLNPVVIGTPTSPNVVHSALVPRTPSGVYICTGLGFTCTSGSLAPAGTRSSRSTCIDLASPWYDSISSFGPDPGATCFAYSQNSCDEAQY
ncbi:hypothetical protein B0H11DRAFT_2229722 [Mycena galericulata]|nr:hypothetical protein B0H11DRAFT_2229722 [Mycena galericulata]